MEGDREQSKETDREEEKSRKEGREERGGDHCCHISLQDCAGDN